MVEGATGVEEIGERAGASSGGGRRRDSQVSRSSRRLGYHISKLILWRPKFGNVPSYLLLQVLDLS